MSEISIVQFMLCGMLVIDVVARSHYSIFSVSPPQTTLNVCHYGKVQLLIGLTDSHTSPEEYNVSVNASVCVHNIETFPYAHSTAHWTLVIGWQRATKQLMCVRVLCGFFVFVFHSFTLFLSFPPIEFFFGFLNVTIFKWLSSRLYVSLLPNRIYL